MALQGPGGHSRALPGRRTAPGNFFVGLRAPGRALPRCSEPVQRANRHGPVPASERADPCGRLWTASNHYVQFLTTPHPYLQLFNLQTPTKHRPKPTSHNPINPVYLTPKPGTAKHDCNRWLREAAVAWMRMMGADSVAHHEKTVMGRADDFPGRALAYYASRGRRHWCGAAAAPSGWAWSGG